MTAAAQATAVIAAAGSGERLGAGSPRPSSPLPAGRSWPGRWTRWPLRGRISGAVIAGPESASGRTARSRRAARRRGRRGRSHPLSIRRPGARAASARSWSPSTTPPARWSPPSCRRVGRAPGVVPGCGRGHRRGPDPRHRQARRPAALGRRGAPALPRPRTASSCGRRRLLRCSESRSLRDALDAAQAGVTDEAMVIEARGRRGAAPPGARHQPQGHDARGPAGRRAPAGVGI